MSSEYALKVSLEQRELSKSSQVLAGIITGIVADGNLHDMEIQMLNTWLSANPEVVSRWPGSAIASQLHTVLADGFVSADEREHLLHELQLLVGNDFSNSGSVTSEVAALPYDLECLIDVRGVHVCHTGEFLYGTRTACERLTELAGGVATGSVTKKTGFLVVGTHVSSAWVNTSYGRKIERAMELREDGHLISIVSEKRWLEALSIRST